jgi:hypothetical protein
MDTKLSPSVVQSIVIQKPQNGSDGGVWGLISP